MHFHVWQSVIGEAPEDLGGPFALSYPTTRPTFDTAAGAVDAASGTAYERWGVSAEAHVEAALLAEMSREAHLQDQGALATWREPNGEGAVWRLEACRCVDGLLAQIFATYD